MRSVEVVLALVALATVVATFARRLRLPAPSLLVVAGLAVGFTPYGSSVHVPPEAIGLIVLPPLLYAAGEELSWRDLKAVWRPVAILAVGLVLVSAAVVGAVTTLVTGLPLALGFLLGAILAATDPVAVTALGRRLSLPPRMQTLVQAESLFNDATSLILYRVAVGIALAMTGTGAIISSGGLAWDFVRLAGGGTLTGAIVAAAVAEVRKRTEDPILESVIALLTPYIAYVVAESLTTSGVTSVVVAGVILGVRAPRLTNARIRLQLGAVYGTVIFILESVVFSLIGLQLPTLMKELGNLRWVLAALAVAVTLLLVRVAWVLPLAGRRSWRASVVVTWAGARGVVPLAAALSIPLALPSRDLLQVLATAVIVISLIVQGFTLAPLVRLTGVAVTPEDERGEHERAVTAMIGAANAYLDGLEDADAVAPVVVERVRRALRDRAEDSDDVAGDYRRIQRAVLGVERAELARMHDEGLIGEVTRRALTHRLDREELRFTED
ncbi:cation:proton antiporter [Streptosporangiaceae bacterium NEAU-GS5]|nr:cation:proton antiporter [Streptosporangiaceae bacterium NEAU-GS5]